MEVSFKFNNGETGSEMVSAILALFGAQQALTNTQAATIVQAAHATPAAILAPADNPAVGTDPDDNGPAHAATHDSEGSPHDARIHSDKMTVTDKGVWRKRKGVAPGTIAQVQAELRAAGKYAAAPAPVAPPAMPPAVAPVAPPVAPAPVMPAMPPMIPVESAYTKFATFVASNLNSATNPQGRLSTDWVSQALASMGYAGPDGVGYMALLEKADADKVQAVHAAFAQALGVAI